jgi:hypothetical protein
MSAAHGRIYSRRIVAHDTCDCLLCSEDIALDGKSLLHGTMRDSLGRRGNLHGHIWYMEVNVSISSTILVPQRASLRELFLNGNTCSVGEAWKVSVPASPFSGLRS